MIPSVEGALRTASPGRRPAAIAAASVAAPERRAAHGPVHVYQTGLRVTSSPGAGRRGSWETFASHRIARASAAVQARYLLREME